VVIIVSRSCTKCDLQVKRFIKHVSRVPNLSCKHVFHLNDSILVHPQLSRNGFQMGSALVDVAPQVETPQGRDLAMGTRKNDRDQYWKPRIMFLMEKQAFMIASKPRSFFLGLCLNLIIFLEKLPQRQKYKYFITYFLFGKKNQNLEE